jgi:hypothetical protein
VGQLSTVYKGSDEQKEITKLLNKYLNPAKKWSEDQILDFFGEYEQAARFKYNKAGHKTKQNGKRQVFRCNCSKKEPQSEAGSSTRNRERSVLYKECPSMVAFSQIAPNSSQFKMEPKSLNFKHNHKPFSSKHIKQRQERALNEAERAFILRCWE